MRRVNYDDWKQLVLARKQSLPLRSPQRRMRKKPRAGEELRLLIQLAFAAKRRALESEEYVRLGPRRWAIHDKRHP